MFYGNVERLIFTYEKDIVNPICHHDHYFMYDNHYVVFLV